MRSKALTLLNRVIANDSVIRDKILKHGIVKTDKIGNIYTFELGNNEVILIYRAIEKLKREKILNTRYLIVKKENLQKTLEEILKTTYNVNGKINIVKYNRKLNNSKPKLNSEIDIIKHEIETINQLMKYGINLTHGDRVKLGKRRAKLKRKLEELRI